MLTSFFKYRTRSYGRIAMGNAGENVDPFLYSWWLLYGQPVMSEGNTARKEIRATLDAF